MDNTDTKYNKWCKSIAESRDRDELIAHFREHVYDHFNRHNRKGELSLKVWLVGVLNFMHILEKKFPNITTEDMLFKLCRYYKNHRKGADPSFDVDEFMKEYNGDIKKYHKEYKIK